MLVKCLILHQPIVVLVLVLVQYAGVSIWWLLVYIGWCLVVW